MTLLKKAIVIFFIPVALSVLAFVIFFHTEQTLLNWMIEKSLLVLAIVAWLFSFPLFLTSTEDNSGLGELLWKTSERLLSYYRTVIFLLLLFFGYILIFSILIFYIFYHSAGVTFNWQQLIAPVVMGAIAAAFLMIKFSWAPFFSLTGEKKGLNALRASARSVPRLKMTGLLFLYFLLTVSASGLIVWLTEDFSTQTILNTVVNSFLPVLFFILLYRLYLKRDVSEKDLRLLRFREWGYKFLMAGGALAVIPMLVLQFNILFRDYDPSFDDSHLRLEEEEFVKEDNLLVHLNHRQAKQMEMSPQYEPEEAREWGECLDEWVTCPMEELMDDVEDFSFLKARAFIEEHPEKAQEFMEDNRQALDCFSRQTEFSHFTNPLCIYCWVPISGKRDEETLPLERSLSPARWLDELRGVSFAAAYLDHHDRTKAARQLFLDMLEIGRMGANNPHPQPIHYLTVGSATQEMALSELLMMEGSRPEPESARKMLKQLEESEITEESYRRLAKLTYMEMIYPLDNIMEMAEFRGITPHPIMERPSFFFKPEKTKRKMAENWKDVVIKGEKEDYLNLIQRKDSVLENITDLFIRDNQLGRVYYKVTFNAMTWGIEREVQEINLKNRLLRAALLLDIQQAAGGQMPESWEELPSRLQERVPEDPFAEGEKLQYEHEEEVIYSVEKKEVEEEQREDFILEL